MAVLTPRAISESAASGGDRIEGSFSFKGPDRDYELNRTPSVNTSSEKLTVSLWWYPTSTIGGTANPANKGVMIGGGADGSWALLQFYDRAIYWGNEADWCMTQGTVNDNCWMHIVLIADTTLADTASRMQIWINGVQQILNTGTLYDLPSQNDNFPLLNNNDKHYIGKRNANDMNADGNISQFYFIDGEAVAATEFGYEDPLTGIWKPKKYTGDYNYTKYDTTNATGGNTILNTNDSGSAVTSGYRTDSSAGTTAGQGLILAWPGNVVDGDVHDHINTGSSAKTVTAENNAEVNTDQSMFYGTAGYVNGSSDSFRVTDHADLALGSGDYTVETWFYPTSLFNNFMMYDGRHPTSGWPTSSGGFALISNANGQVSTYTAGAYTAQTGNYAIAVNTWNHVAVVRNSGTQKIYINGKEKASASNSTNHTEQKCNIGNAANDGEGSKGYYNDFRIYKGTAKYTSDFIPPTFSIGGNSFYLPFDGSAPLGRDQSGIGNDWNVEGGGNSVTEDRATGAIPILNTVNSGGSAVPGVRGEVGIAVTVYNDGGGNKYYLDGQQAGTVNFIPGQTVKFDTSDSTCSGHPFRISTTSDGTHGGGSAYADGNIAAGTAGADSTGVDFDGDDSIVVDQSSSEFSLQSDFTIEGWVKCDAFTTDCAVFSCWRTSSGGNRNLIIGPNASGSNDWVFMYNTDGSGSGWVTIANPDAWTGEWVHLAYSYTHSGTTHRAFLNGTLVGTNSGAGIYNDSSAQFILGLNCGNGSGYFDGKMWNVRFSNSVRYTDSFTPQRTPFATDGNTVFLGCLDSSSATTAVTNTAGSITGGGNPSVYTIVEDTLTPSTKITVPHNAPSNLYYYCTAHSGMGGSIKIGASDPLQADPYASSCHFAWPCTDIYDVSDKVNCKSLKKALTITNSVATSETRTNFYGRSYYSSGTDPRVHTNPFHDLAAGTGDFTYELWFWWDDQGSNATIGASRDSGNTANGWSTDIISDHYIQMWCDDANNATATNTIQQSEWNHFACVRKSGTMKFYINGVEQSSESVANDFSVFENGLNLGTVPTGSNDFQGYYSDVRYYNGVAKYDGEFFPASCHPNVTPESPTGVTWDSPRPDKLESDGSAYFDGDGDYLDIATVDTAFGTGTDWTMEMWICPHEVDLTAITDPRTSGSSVHPLLWISGGNGGKPTGVLYYYTAGADKIVGRTVLVPHRWYHAAVVRYNNITTLYLDGKYEGSFADSEDYVTATNFRIGGRYTGTLYEFEGYISNFRLVNGTAVYTQEFIPPKKALTNITNTKLLCLQTKNSVTQALGDSGSLTRASQLGPSDYNPFNYTGASLRPMNYAIVRDNGPKGLYRTLVDSSGLKVQTSSGSPGGGLWTSSIPMKTGKWYAEIRCTAHSSVHMMIGICKADGIDCNVQINESSLEPGWGIGHISGDGSYRRICWGANWGSSQNGVENWAETWGTGDYMGIMLNCDDKIMSFFKNGKNMGNSESGFQRDPDWGSLMDGKDGISSADIGSGMVFCGGNGQASTTSDWELNFGQRPWKYPPRMDDRRGGASYQHLGEYYAASMQNTYERTPVLNPKKEAHNTALWNGTGSTHMINAGFQPDLVAIKKRSGGSNTSWQWYDSVRGATWSLKSDGGINLTGDETENTAGLTSFNSDGFTVSTDDGVNGTSSSPKYAAWCWKAGGNKGTWNVNDEDRGSATAAGLTAGDTSVLTGCSINTKSGFGIVSWTQDSGGASKSIAHGLTEAPAFVIMKQLNVGSNSNFFVYHHGLSSAAKVLYLNGGEAEDTSSDFGNTAPSSTVITTSTTGVNGRKVIMWYWANIPGVQKFDRYEGNGDADNQYVHLGFRPAILWVKKRDNYYSWFCYDDRRGENYNPRDDIYHPNDPAAEYSGSNYNIDFLPEGFKVRSSHASCGTTEPYIYCAWAATAGFSQYSGATRLGSGRTEGSDS